MDASLMDAFVADLTSALSVGCTCLPGQDGWSVAEGELLLFKPTYGGVRGVARSADAV